MASVILSKVGDLKLHLGTTPPAGYLSMSEGSLLSREVYAELWKWANDNNLVISDSAWTAEVNNNGSCAKFGTGNGSTTFHMPKIVSLLKANQASTAGSFNKAVYNNQHYHGMGDMVDNNGTWGNLPYTATYPAGTTGYFWNGKGGHSVTSAPVTNGSVITSFNIGNDSSEVPSPASVNLMLCIRYTLEHQETAATTSESAALAAVDRLASLISDTSTCVKVEGAVYGKQGWIVYTSGEVVEWGNTTPGSTKGNITFPLSLGSKPLTVALTVCDPEGKADDVLVAVVQETSATGFTYKVHGNMPSTAYLNWKITGVN